MRLITVLVCMLQQISANKNVSYRHSWPDVHQLANIMDILCPYNTICRGGEPTLQLSKGKTDTSCCTECSCEESCGFTHNCCFSELDTYNVIDRSHQKCLPTATITRYGDIRLDYYMVVNRYPNGSGDECGYETIACGENEKATPLGSLYPVSSKISGIIYKNEICALCHGVDKTDQIPWDIMMICNQYKDYVRLDMGAFSKPLEMGKFHKFCYLKFRYPGIHDDVMPHVCYENTVHTCKQNEARHFQVPDNLNMTEEEIRAACVSELKAPYMNSYFNAFCYLCNYKAYQPLRKCEDTEAIDAGKDSGLNKFTAIIDISYIEKKSEVVAKDKCRPKRLACKFENGLVKISDDCRPAICPLGRVALDQSCVFLYKELVSDFQLVVKLYPWTTMPTSSHEYIKTRLETGVSWWSLLSVKGIKSWRLNALLCYTESHRNGNESVGYFWAQLTFVKENANLQYIISNVDRLMTHNWTMLLNESNVILKPQFSDFELVERVDRNFYKAVYGNGASNDLINSMHDPFLANSSPQTLKETYLNIFTGYPSITKMFFCDQIALQHEEYQLDSSSHILYVNAINRTFFSTEFSFGFDTNDELEPRLCLNDADYVLQIQQCSSSWSSFSLTNQKLVAAMIIALRNIISP